MLLRGEQIVSKHKWHKEIKAWADGAEIEQHDGFMGNWWTEMNPSWWNIEAKFRIKNKHQALIDAHKEGAEIQYLHKSLYGSSDNNDNNWRDCTNNYPRWDLDTEYRIKPQHKEPQYLYVFLDKGVTNRVSTDNTIRYHDEVLIGKIKLEDE